MAFKALTLLMALLCLVAVPASASILTAAASANTTCAKMGCHFYSKKASCACNDECTRFNDCCSDYESVCHSHHGGGGGVTGGPQQIHLSLTNSTSEMQVIYATGPDQSYSWCVISDGTNSKNVSGYSWTYNDGGWTGRLHKVTFQDLTHPTRYTYSCGGSSERFDFVPAPPVGTLPVTIALVADLGEGCSTPGCGNATIARLAAEAESSSFDILVHAGDIAYTSGDQSIWDEYLREMQPIAARKPYMVVCGNHEHYYNFSGYLHRFSMPGPTYVPTDPALSTAAKTARSSGAPLPKDPRNVMYGFDYGGVHFTAFSTEHVLEDQIAFLKQDLQKAAANRALVPWIVVFAHKPLYCSTDDYFDCQVNGPDHIAALVEPLLHEYGVDLFVAGHLHNYERTWPVFNGTITKSYNNPGRTVHVVVGDAGCNEGLTNQWVTQPEWSAVRNATLGFAKLQVDKETLAFQLIASETGAVIDKFNITKTQSLH